MKLTDVVMWSPKPENETRLDNFMKYVNKNCCLSLESFDDVYKWSIKDVSLFWEQVWLFCKVLSSHPYKQVLPPNTNISDLPPRWFEGSALNYAEHALQWNDDHVALHAANEGSLDIKTVTYRELKEQVRIFSSALRNNGVQQGDRVVGYIPNCIEAIVGMLATSSIGAIWSSTSPDFGVNGVLDRFTQISPKIIISVNTVRYNNKNYSHLNKLQQVVNGLPDLEKVIIIRNNSEQDLEISHISHSVWWEHFIAGADDSELEFTQLPFSHPLYIMYSSGTTGAPKCIVHSQGGVLMKHYGEHVLQGNVTRSEVMLYYTTTGWMMWNWLVGVLTCGGTCVLYDGSPLIPNANILWDLIDKLNITTLGTGAKWLTVLQDKNIKPHETNKLTSLRSVLSTGSPLKPDSYDYVYRDIKSDLLLGSITGGTDIVGCFAAHNWNIPVIRGEIQSRVLGCAMESWSEDGNPVFDESGELVVTKPFPSMPIFFWNDEDGAKYRKAYFSKYPGVWSHGDFCMINSSTGGIIMLGRSDGTLNPNGVRFGSAEIYNIAEKYCEVADSVCVAQRNQDNTEERVVLFLKLSNDCQFNADLVNKLRAEIRTLLSARHIPAVILPIKDIPYTISGKKVEVAVRDTIAGREILHKAAFSNPESLDLYKNIPDLDNY